MRIRFPDSFRRLPPRRFLTLLRIYIYIYIIHYLSYTDTRNARGIRRRAVRRHNCFPKHPWPHCSPSPGGGICVWVFLLLLLLLVVVVVVVVVVLRYITIIIIIIVTDPFESV